MQLTLCLLAVVGGNTSVLVGNKCDMEDKRQVTYEQGKSLADQWGVPFMETSAKAKINNEECFYQVVREIRKREAEKESSTGGKPKPFRCIIL